MNSPDLDTVRFDLNGFSFTWDGATRQLTTDPRYPTDWQWLFEEVAANHVPAVQVVRRVAAQLQVNLKILSTLPAEDRDIPADAEA
jgi:CHAT domain-containing protein